MFRALFSAGILKTGIQGTLCRHSLGTQRQELCMHLEQLRALKHRRGMTISAI